MYQGAVSLLTHLLLQMRVLVEEQFVREQFLAHATYVIKLISGNDEHFVGVFGPYTLDPLNDLWFLSPLVQQEQINAGRERSHIHKTILKLNAIATGLCTKDSVARLQKVVTVFLRLEPNEVRTKHTLQQFLSNGQTSKDLGGWERDVEEEADLGIRDLFSNHVGNQK